MNRPPGPALVDCPRGSSVVLAKPLAVIEGRPALVEQENYRAVGTVRTATIIVEGFHRHVWRGFDNEGKRRAEAATKPAAIAALLAEIGLVEVRLEDTIPDLLAGL